MGALDAYVTPAEYDGRSKRSSASDEWVLLEELMAASELIDHDLGLTRGAFNAWDGSLVFAGNGRSTLRLEDGSGQYFLRAPATVEIGGVTLTLNDPDGPQGLPRNAPSRGRPYDRLELPGGAWPAGLVTVTGAWGWAEVPPGVKDLVTSLTRDLRDHHAAGGSGRLQSLDGGDIPLADQTWRQIRALKRQFSYRTGLAVA